jgi:hypothetical protein
VEIEEMYKNTSILSEEIYKNTCILNEEMYKNTSILSEEICLKHGMYFSTKLRWEWLTLVTVAVLQAVSCLQTALHIQLSHNRFSESGVNPAARTVIC